MRAERFKICEPRCTVKDYHIVFKVKSERLEVLVLCDDSEKVINLWNIVTEVVC